MVFAFLPAGRQVLLHPWQICNCVYRDRTSARHKDLCTLTCYLLPINFVPRHSYISQNLYPDGKNHAIPSLHRDSFLAKVSGSWPDASSGNVYSLNRRAVSKNAGVGFNWPRALPWQISSDNKTSSPMTANPDAQPTPWQLSLTLKSFDTLTAFVAGQFFYIDFSITHFY